MDGQASLGSEVIERLRGTALVDSRVGAPNMVNCVCRLDNCDGIHGLMGGLQLGRASHKRLGEAGVEFARRHFQCLAPYYWTAMNARRYLRARFQSLMCDLSVGSRLVFE